MGGGVVISDSWFCKKALLGHKLIFLPITFARSNDVFLLVHVIFVAFDVAAPALQGGWRLEDVPQRLGARLAVGGEVVKCWDELVALVADVTGLLSNRQRLHWKLRLFFALAFIGIENLEQEIVSVLFLLTEKRQQRPQETLVRHTWNILGISLASARYTSV